MLVLKKTKLGETDLIVTLLDASGLQKRAVAKGARRPGSFWAARLELYMVVEAQCSTGRSLDIITDARVEHTNAGCRADLEHSAAAACPIELVERATSEGSSEPLLFTMTCAALEHIGGAQGNAPALISLACVLKLCTALGVRPDAEELLGVEAQTATWVERLLGARFAELESYTGAEYLPVLQMLSGFCQRWLREHLELKLKSLEFLQTLLG
jgi:DNA repair protein RecO (recombination protein O)